MRTFQAAVALVLLAGCASAQATPEAPEGPVCMGRDQAVAVLEGKHGETRRATMLSNDGTIIEIFANGTGTWTVLRTAPSGLSCVLEIGEGFFDAPATTPAAPPPAKPAEWEA